MIKTGLIGNGYWGKILEDKLNGISELLFVQTSKGYNPKVFKEADWVFIATPVETHFGIAKDCIMSGVNVFIEKPATEKESEYIFLIKLAKSKNVKIYVSNVFLFRNELTGQKNVFNLITFTWHKSSESNGTILNDFLYHDLYILASIYGIEKSEHLDLYANNPNRLFFSIKYGDAKVYFDYRRDKESETKKLINFGAGTIYLTKTEQDPLKEMILKCLNNELDFEKNYKLNLHTLNLMDTIKQNIK